MSKITVFTAKRIHTMTDSAPQATAVAVRDGVILEAGALDSLAPWLDAHPHEVDDRFADKVILPGFIDPHLHPFIGAVLLPTRFITAFEWDLPGQSGQATRGHSEYLAAVQKAIDTDDGAQPIFVTWGYHQIWHGQVTRAQLNEISETRPILVWHRSFHEVILNDAAIALLNIDAEVMETHPQIDAAAGRFSETGAMVAIEGVKPILFSPTWFGAGLAQLHEVLHAGGHTTVADMAWGMFDYELEWAAYTHAMDSVAPPYRVMMVPRGLPDPELTGSPEAAFDRVDALTDRGTDRLFFDRHVKFFTDGAFFSELMQLGDPGYIDGHHGEWLTAPEQFEAIARPYWNAGYRIHVHCTGDLGVELALDVLDKLQFERPRVDHRFTIEHFGVSTEDQVRRIKALGALVSANVYYLHELGEAYWRESIGHERASQMARLGSLARADVPFALHSDFTMAPAHPLTSVWVAVNRFAESGAVLGENERISIHQALKAITIDAAWVLGQEGQIGSIRSGKKADFTVLDEDPYEVDPAKLKDIRIDATVFEGAVHPRPK
ncbi:amidohydrolase [Phaeobacter gallaeciensis]|uniref:Amidohydrolase n=1 Tax=Phaeobacter gallaeciensis TaxID=60890 RepID=A0A366XBH6_9RHOB|nr:MULTISPECIES: amidohydrolase [Roseobacteraceae]MBT8169300.1 amidohydrolase [Falsiruegeria litorea]RBW60535.1 amidohydrolase [Phaeobacter gallaeciensis]